MDFCQCCELGAERLFTRRRGDAEKTSSASPRESTLSLLNFSQPARNCVAHSWYVAFHTRYVGDRDALCGLHLDEVVGINAFFLIRVLVRRSDVLLKRANEEARQLDLDCFAAVQV